jgi:hypothetical protein
VHELHAHALLFPCSQHPFVLLSRRHCFLLVVFSRMFVSPFICRVACPLFLCSREGTLEVMVTRFNVAGLPMVAPASATLL